MSSKRAGLLAGLCLFGLAVVALMFGFFAIEAWTLQSGSCSAPSTLTRAATSLVCIIPILLSVIIVKLFVALGKREVPESP